MNGAVNIEVSMIVGKIENYILDPPSRHGSVPSMRVDFKLVGILGDEEGVAEFKFIYTLLFILYFVEHLLLLLLDLVERCDGGSVEVVLVRTQSGRSLCLVHILGALLGSDFGGEFFQFQLLGLVFEGDEVFIFLLCH